MRQKDVEAKEEIVYEIVFIYLESFSFFASQVSQVFSHANLVFKYMNSLKVIQEEECFEM